MHSNLIFTINIMTIKIFIVKITFHHVSHDLECIIMRTSYQDYILINICIPYIYFSKRSIPGKTRTVAFLFLSKILNFANTAPINSFYLTFLCSITIILYYTD